MLHTPSKSTSVTLLSLKIVALLHQHQPTSVSTLAFILFIYMFRQAGRQGDVAKAILVAAFYVALRKAQSLYFYILSKI